MYPYSFIVPKNESFAFPPGRFNDGQNIYEYDNIKIKYIDFQRIVDFINELIEYDSIIIHNNCKINKNLNFVGNVVYLDDAASMPDPEDQEGTIFILNETADINNKIENLTCSEGLVIVDDAILGGGTVNKALYSVANVSCSTGIQLWNHMLEHNDSFGFVENGIITIIFNATCKINEEYAILTQIPNYIGIRNIYKYTKWVVDYQGFNLYMALVYLLQKLSVKLPNCKAFILYDSYDQHLMGDTGYNWSADAYEEDAFIKPIFTVNNSVGTMIRDYLPFSRITCKVIRSVDVVTAHNVLGNLTIPQSPQNKVAIISNRYDGWWGQTPGDSGFGAGIVLGIARHLKELKEHYNVLPKYNTTFLFTTGEEYGLRGAYYFSDLHKESTQYMDKIAYWLVLDQLAFNQTHVIMETSISTDKGTILRAIIDDSNFKARTGGYPFEINDDTLKGTEQKVFADAFPNADIVCMADDKNYEWDFYHRTGSNFIKGDAMGSLDRHKGNVTAEIAWNITKYFLMNPDCRFNGTVSYSKYDNHTIRAAFSVVSCLPVDKVRVKASVINCTSNATIFWKNFDFLATREGDYQTIDLTILPTMPSGYYRLYLELYNSTGRINEIALGSGVHNDSDLQTGSYLLVPRGNTRPGKPSVSGPQTLKINTNGTFNASTTDPEADNVQFHWNWNNEDCDFDGPHASGEVCFMNHSFPKRGPKTITVRARDDFLGCLFDGPTDLPSSLRYGANWSDWSDPFTVNVKYLVKVDVSTTSMSAAKSSMSTTLESIINSASIYETAAFGGMAPYSYEWYFGNECYRTQEERFEYDFDQVGVKTVTLNVTDAGGYWEMISFNVSVVNLSASFNVSIPWDFAGPGQDIVFTDTSATRSGLHIANWTWDFGDGTMAYIQNVTHSFNYLGKYIVSLTVSDNETGTSVYLMPITVSYDIDPPAIGLVSIMPDTVGFGQDVSIVANVVDDLSGVASVFVNVTYPDNSFSNQVMARFSDDAYCLVFSDTWQCGQYGFHVHAVDYENNSVRANGSTFTVAANATISVVTLKDSYTGTEFINLTDPPGDPAPPLGYELLDDGAVLHLWNQYDSYYFNTSSGIQLTNHKDHYWSRNVLMLGYYNNDQWNLLYRTDELTGFTKHIETDDATYVNITLWKDLSHGGYSFRLAIRYHLGVNDNDLTVIPSIKNIGTTSIPYVLGFGWELKDIQINMTTQGDYILVDQDKYLLNQTLDNSFTNLNDTVFYLMEDVTGSQTKSLYLRWNPDLTYKLLVKSRPGQQNAPVTLFIRVGTLAVGQQKHTLLRWYDASQETFYFNGFDENEAWEFDPELMTDGDVETFAKSCSNNEVEFCNLNTYEGDGRGAILKVELRTYGYYDDEQGNITLVPVFGENRGENYTFVTTDRAEWSSWFDITNDEGRGSGQWITPWEWSEVETLGCHVISHASKGTTLYCSKVELRVTYNTAPVVSNPSPSYGVNGVGLRPWVNITVSDPDGDSMNVTWYSNSTLSLLTLRPNANGSSTQLSRYPGSATANYLCVDEAVADDADYVYWSGTTWKKDTYNLANRGTASGVIHGVTVYARCNRGGIGEYPSVPNQGKIIIRSNDSYYDGNEFTPTSTFTSYSHTWSVNPATGNPWSWSAVDALEAGIAFIGNEAGASKCSQVYIVVNYTDPNTWLQFGQNSSVSNGICRQQFLNASVNGQWWYWKVKADNGTLSTWSSVYKFYTGYQSKIENIGETTIKGYLLMQVQYYNETSEEWMLDIEVVNQTMKKVINASEQLGLDQFFNGEVRTNDLSYGAGTYRVYAAFRDPEGNILSTSDENKLEAWWLFTKT